ncbi:vacuolar import and degradation protein-domain-containing protein [Gloeopeniophorella convolvens]|nr:vacuolar import and degradation protein-domain-containing protein [Gloeopeniophorella convolvens]
MPSKAVYEIPVSSAASKRAALTITTSVASDALHPASPSNSPFVPSPVPPSAASLHFSARPDPFVDITRIRMRSQGHHCLYPGATFQGTQKSGRNSYDVTVSIVDVDFSSSFLCGYLCIRGLTDDWPELTTYFDAEIIGSRYGFLTRNWGANEQEDMVHWARFPAFRHVKNKLKAPHLTMDGYPGAVFMRWKERFLVPDHRVQDINGASFAGFYYVCVDFNSHAQAPATPTRQFSQQTPVLREELDVELSQSPTVPKPESTSARRTRGASVHDDYAVSQRSSSVGARSGPGVATMSGFYFHQNSEPYQQLSLQHVPESVSTSFELR